MLRELERPDTAIEAHRVLVSTGYWAPHTNPHPARLGLDLRDHEAPRPALPNHPRRDLTHLDAFAIDNATTDDPDDAISHYGDRVWVHIADVASVVKPGGEVDQAARRRATSLYLREATINMLPSSHVEVLGLGLQARSPALSVGFRLTDDGRVEDPVVVPSWVRVTRHTYAEVDDLRTAPAFKALGVLAQRYDARRVEAGAAMLTFPDATITVPPSGRVTVEGRARSWSSKLVASFMTMAGEAVAAFALERGIPMPYVCHEAPDATLPADDLASHYAYRRRLKRSLIDTAPAPHAGLGVAAYVRVTSPLRRYLDLVVHQQLRAWLTDRPLRSADELAEVISLIEPTSRAAQQAQRLTDRHWTLVYLKQQGSWQGEAIVMGYGYRQVIVSIPAQGMEARIPTTANLDLNQVIQLKVRSVDLAASEVGFQVLRSC